MKILFMGPLPEPVTGQSLACKLLYERMRVDHEVTLVDLKKKSFQQGANSVGRLIEIFGMAMRVVLKRAGCRRVYFTISESVAGNLKDLLFYCLLIGKLDRTIVHLHGGAGLRVLLSSAHPWLRALNKFFLRRLGRVILLGERHVPMFDGLVDRSRIRIVENFALDTLFIPLSDLEAKWARPNHRLKLLFLSNLLPGKGHTELVDAVAGLAASERERIEVHFAGGFESSDQERRFLESIAGISCIQYHGIVHGDTKRRLLWDANLFCLPTYYAFEGQPISILEAYASGCAVMTTDHSGIFDTFVPGENGCAVAKASVAAIRDAIRQAITEPATLVKMAHHNRRMADLRFRQSVHLSNIMAVVGECMALTLPDGSTGAS